MVSGLPAGGRVPDDARAQRRVRFERTVDRFVPAPLAAHREQVLYLVVGGWNTVAGYGAFAILYYFYGAVLSDPVILVGSYVFAIANAYVGYRYVAFRSHEPILREFPRFSLVYLATLAVNLVVFPVALGLLPLGAYAVQALFMVGVIIASYLAHRHFSFRRPVSDVPAAHEVPARPGAASQESGPDRPPARVG